MYFKGLGYVSEYIWERKKGSVHMLYHIAQDLSPLIILYAFCVVLVGIWNREGRIHQFLSLDGENVYVTVKAF